MSIAGILGNALSVGCTACNVDGNACVCMSAQWACLATKDVGRIGYIIWPLFSLNDNVISTQHHVSI